MTRIRSPNYPQIPLGTAIDCARKIHSEEAQHCAPREVVAKLMGYSGLNGAAVKKIGALTAYGLLERGKDKELKVSDLAMSILFSTTENEKLDAQQQAAFNPPLFKDIKEKWKNDAFSDENLKVFLIRNGFNLNAVGQVIDCYRSTIELISAKNIEIDPPGEGPSIIVEEIKSQENDELIRRQPPSSSKHVLEHGKPIIFDMETVSGQYSFDNADDLTDFIDKLGKIKSLMPSKN